MIGDFEIESKKGDNKRTPSHSCLCSFGVNFTINSVSTTHNVLSFTQSKKALNLNGSISHFRQQLFDLLDSLT